MAKLNVVQLGADRVQFESAIYQKAGYPIQVGDIVRCEECDDDFTIGAFYTVEYIDSCNDFQFHDDDDTRRERDHRDSEWIPYRKVADAVQPTTLVIDQPVHLVIKNIASITFEGGVVGATTV